MAAAKCSILQLKSLVLVIKKTRGSTDGHCNRSVDTNQTWFRESMAQPASFRTLEERSVGRAGQPATVGEAKGAAGKSGGFRILVSS